MLVEKSDSQTSAFKPGDTVKIRSTGQIGTLLSYENGFWKVSVHGATQMFESSSLEHKQILMG